MAAALYYTSVEFDALVEDLTRFALAETSLDLSALQNPHDPAHLMVKLAAAVGDLLAFNLMKWVREAIPSESLREANFDSVASGFGYQRSKQTAASGDLTITFDLDAVGGGPATIAKTTKFSDGTETFEFDAPVVVGPGVGVVTATASASHGATTTQSVATSNGSQNQIYALSATPLLETTLTVTVAAVAWTRVAPWELILARPTDTVYTVLYGNDGTAYIQFGDDLNGKVPVVGSLIEAVFKVGGGYEGNAAAGKISQITTAVTGLLTVTNATGFEGGNPAQTLRQAKAALPAFIRANDRCVISDDYAQAAVGVSGIAKAISAKGSCGIGCGGSQVVYAIPNGGGLLSITQIQQISNAIKAKRPPNKKILVRDAVRADIRVEALLIVESDVRAADVRSVVSNLLSDELDLTNRQFGDLIKLQSMYEIVSPSVVRGLSGVLFREFTVLPYANRYQAGTAGDGSVSSISYTGDSRREWRIEITAGGSAGVPGQFTVWERYVGNITSLSSNALLDESAMFPANTFFTGGWSLVVDPESGSAAQTITGNSETSVTTGGAVDLRDQGTAGDPYVIQKAQANVGKIFSETVAAALPAGATVFPLTTGWAIGDLLEVTDGTITFQTTIIGGGAGAWVVSVPVPAAGLASITAKAVWVSDNGLLSFAVSRGTVNWSAGDELYVDTYESKSDLQFRPLVFPELTAENLILRTSGGL